MSFELRIERTFSAAHAIVIQGEREPLHGHDWRVLVAVRGPQLDQEELLCDFHAIEQQVDGVIAPFHNANLNETAPF
ncbi:MAG: 6-carboxytetrahydropterin synthase, partial [Planctomycetota bacterium]|nr:6-carboxytetrahydropterin synthase [Planctomycetota bacterium]